MLSPRKGRLSFDRHFLLLVLLVIINSLWVSNLWAESTSRFSLDNPFVTSNRNPFVQVYGLPETLSADILSTGESSASLQLEAVSNFTVSDSSNEAIFIDGETHRITMQFFYGFASDWELGISVPHLSHQSGSLDSFIDDWHDFWNMPDGGRTNFARDQLRFDYQRQGQLLFTLDEPTDGIGDVSLVLSHQLSSVEGRTWTVRSELTLPTGDAEEMLGSEATGLALGLYVTDRSIWQGHNITLHGNVGALWLEDGEILSEQREDWVIYGSSTLGWRVAEDISLKIQLDGHSAFYDSALAELGDPSLQFILGGALRLSSRWALDIAVSEDIAVDTAPDVVFHLGINYR